MSLTDYLNWKLALVVHTIFYSLGLLEQGFYLGQLWFIINTFVLLLLLRSAYSTSPSSWLMTWYLYCLSIFTDLISLITFGSDLTGGGTPTFVLVMAIFLLLPKPVFLYFLYCRLKERNIDFKQGVKYDTLVDEMTFQSKDNANEYQGPISSQEQQRGSMSNDNYNKNFDNVNNNDNNNINNNINNNNSNNNNTNVIASDNMYPDISKQQQSMQNNNV